MKKKYVYSIFILIFPIMILSFQNMTMGATSTNPFLPPQPTIMDSDHDHINGRDIAIINKKGTALGDRANAVIPALRTSSDGRIGVQIRSEFADTNGPVLSGEKDANGILLMTDKQQSIINFYLLKPERANLSRGNIALLPAGYDFANPDSETNKAVHLSFNMIDVVNSEPILADREANFPARHVTICEPNPGMTPKHLDGKDVYNIVLIAFSDNLKDENNKWRVRISRLKFEIIVENPKSEDAKFTIKYKGKETGKVYLPEGIEHFLEPMITSDGQLIVGRAGTAQLKGFNSRYDMIYLKNQNKKACDITGWTTAKPVLYGFYDPDLRDNNKLLYEFARYEIRDTQNNRISPSLLNSKKWKDLDFVNKETLNVKDLPGSYPWVDRKGRNLFFYSINSQVSSSTLSRFDLDCNGECSVGQEPIRTRGISLAGGWTHGKTVLLDGVINNTDFIAGSTPNEQFGAKLYSGSSGDVFIRMAHGRGGLTRKTKPNTDAFAYPLVSLTQNISIFDSLENIFNEFPALIPKTPRDVVWRMNRGFISEEVAFDDYIDPNILIYAPMNGSLDSDGKYFDGFNGFDFIGGESVLIQNAATSPGLPLPRYGKIEKPNLNNGLNMRNVRVEPVALGGIEGRGLYLQNYLQLVFDKSSTTPETNTTMYNSIYMSVFFDHRNFLPTDERQIFSIEKSTNLREIVFAMINAKKALKIKIGNNIIQTIPTNTSMNTGWVNLGVLLRLTESRPAILTYLNGNLINTLEIMPDKAKLILDSLKSNVRYVVGNKGSGSTGGTWFDDFKVILNADHFATISELPCNHARGTLVRKSNGNETCLVDYITGNFPEITEEYTSLRHGILFEGKNLIWNKPRPDFTKNKFCLSCHTSNQATPALQVTAPLRAGGLVHEVNDPRRQPMAPPRWLKGYYPENYFEANTAAFECSANIARLCAIDRWLLNAAE